MPAKEAGEAPPIEKRTVVGLGCGHRSHVKAPSKARQVRAASNPSIRSPRVPASPSDLQRRLLACDAANDDMRGVFGYHFVVMKLW